MADRFPLFVIGIMLAVALGGIVAMVGFTGGGNRAGSATLAPLEYAPPEDPDTGETYAKAWSDDAVHVEVADGWHVHATGHYLDEENWQPFPLEGDLQEGWIVGGATAEFAGPREGHVIVYACKEYRDRFVCGPAADSNEERWTLVPYGPANGSCDVCVPGETSCGATVGWPDGTGDHVRTCRVVDGCAAWVQTETCAPGYCRSAACVFPDGIDLNSYCESSPDAKCLLYPAKEHMHSTGKRCEWQTGDSETTWALDKGCWECDDGYVWAGEECVRK